MISTLQISPMLDYNKDCFTRICKGIKINKLLLYLSSGGHGDVRQGFLAVKNVFTAVNDC